MILLVDDEPLIGQVGAELLKSLNYDVLVAQNGNEALELYSRNREKIRLVILDMVMPGMGGDQVFEKLKEIDPRVRVLLSSGYSLNEQAEEILNKGCQGFLQKPFNMVDLSNKLKQILAD